MELKKEKFLVFLGKGEKVGMKLTIFLWEKVTIIAFPGYNSRIYTIYKVDLQGKYGLVVATAHLFLEISDRFGMGTFEICIALV